MNPEPASNELTALVVPVELRDGSRVRIRQVRPSDEDLLLSGFEQLSPTSRYRRFLSPVPELSRGMVRYLIDVDHHNHEAVVALDDAAENGLGIARYVRDQRRPETAEVAVTVIDEWQGRGLGTLLLDAISVRAHDEGITTFTALMLAENKEMLDLLKALGPVRVLDRSTGTVEVEVAIPATGVPVGLRELLRIAAQHDVAVPLMRSHEIRAGLPRDLGVP
jgi:GNAT superfamily N-acetyltransferase